MKLTKLFLFLALVTAGVVASTHGNVMRDDPPPTCRFLPCH